VIGQAREKRLVIDKGCDLLETLREGRMSVNRKTGGCVTRDKYMSFNKELAELLEKYDLQRCEVSLSAKSFEKLGEKPHDGFVFRHENGRETRVMASLPERKGESYTVRGLSGYWQEPLVDD
jgi:CHAD domain-containing protein